MFDFLKKNKVKLPDDYKDLINEKDYATFLNSCLTVLKGLNLKVISSDNGDIVYENKDGEEAHYYLDNILRKYIQLPINERDEEVKRHFEKLQDKSDAYNYFFKDFDYAKQFLKVVIKPIEMLENYGEFVHRLDFPNLVTFLVFDFEEQFHYIKNDNASEWQVDEQDLFEIALDNLGNEEIEAKEYTFGDRFKVYILFSGDFSAPFTLLIDKYLEFSIGTYGTMLAIPTKGTVFMHPIETKEVLDLTEILHPEIEKFYHEDQGNISLDFYWFYQGQFYLFKKEYHDNQQVTINLPDKLERLYNER
ncbi:MAG: hypothetical protein Q7U47_06265 [Paludibacter sp.]|nr:hypothetical protein [Paludibacter sp.]